jgi:cell volume regulation protein A
MFPVLAHAPDAERVFDLVFFVVVVNSLVPGATVRWATRRLGVEVKGPPPPSAELEIASARSLHADLLSFYIEPASAVAGAHIAELPFPTSASVMLIVRGEDLVPAKGSTRLDPGDHVYVFCQPEDRAMITLLFGAPDED